MTAMPVTYYQAKCDVCGQLYDGEDFGSAFEDANYALELAESCGWLRERGTLLTCPDCLKCARCGNSPARVGGYHLTTKHSQILCEECEPGPARLSITDRGRAVIESGLTLRQAHEIETGCTPDQLCDRCRKDLGTES